MARYRKIAPRIWNDGKFRELSDDAKLIFFLLLTHPHMTALGAMRATLAGLAAELGWAAKRFHRGFTEIRQRRMVRYDEGSSLIWLPNFLKCNPPENPNVVKSWQASLDLLPECGLKDEIIQACHHLIATLPKGFAQGLPEPFRKAMPNLEPEQEPELEPQQEGSPPLFPLTGEPRQTPPSPAEMRGRQAAPTSPFPPNYAPSTALRASITAKYPGVDVDAQVDAMRDWALSKGICRSDWDAELRTFARRAHQDLHGNGRTPPRHASTTEHNLAALVEAQRLNRERSDDAAR
jgi:hypothetical protein